MPGNCIRFLASRVKTSTKDACAALDPSCATVSSGLVRGTFAASQLKVLDSVNQRQAEPLWSLWSKMLIIFRMTDVVVTCHAHCCLVRFRSGFVVDTRSSLLQLETTQCATLWVSLRSDMLCRLSLPSQVMEWSIKRMNQAHQRKRHHR